MYSKKNEIEPKINWRNLKEVEDLADSLKDKQAIFINIDDTKLDLKGTKNLVYFLKKIPVIGIDSYLCSQLDKESLDYFFSYLKETQIAHLKFSLYDSSIIAIDDMTSFLQGTKVTELGIMLENDDMIKLVNQLRTLPITCLKIFVCDFDPASLSALGCYLKESNIKKLVLSGNGLDSTDIEILGPYLEKTTIKHLNLGFNELCSKGLETLSGYLANTMISKLDLHRNGIGSEGVEALGRCLKKTAIKKIDFGLNDIDFNGARKLLGYLKSSRVTGIDLFGIILSSDDLKSLAGLLQGTCITYMVIQAFSNNSTTMRQIIEDNFRCYWGKYFAQINYWRCDDSLACLSVLPLEVVDHIFSYLAPVDKFHRNIFLQGYQAYCCKILEREETLNPLLEDDNLMPKRKKIKLK